MNQALGLKKNGKPIRDPFNPESYTAREVIRASIYSGSEDGGAAGKARRIPDSGRKAWQIFDTLDAWAGKASRIPDTLDD